MRKIAIFLFVISVFSTTITSFAQVITLETSQYEDIVNVVRTKEKNYSVDKILLVFDIDNTLLTSGVRIGSDIWYQWQTDKLSLKSDPDTKVPCLYDNTIALLYELGPMQLTEPQIPMLLKEWQKKHITFALTSRAPDTQYATLRELNRNGIDFSVSALAGSNQADVPFAQGKLKRPWLYSQGVFFSSGQDKGMILDFLLNKYDKRFDAIVFVDDGIANIIAMKNMLNSKAYSAIDASLIHYTRVESDLIARQGTVLTSIQAEKMVQDWRMLSSTLHVIFPERQSLCFTR